MHTHNTCALQWCEQEPIDNADGLTNYNYIHNVHIWHRITLCEYKYPCKEDTKNVPKELCLHTDLVLVFDIKSSTFDEVFHHWQVSIHGCHVECCILCISEIKHVNSHHRSKVLGNANMATNSR